MAGLRTDLEAEKQVTRLQAVARGRKARSKIMSDSNLTDEQKQKLERARRAGAGAQRTLFKDVYELLGVSKDEYNSMPGVRQAYTYLEQHQVIRLLETLLARAALERPTDLRVYLIDTIREMQATKGTPSMGAFTDEDLETMFDMWDELKKGTIPLSKVAETLRALHCSPGREDQVVQETVGQECTEVDRKTFTRIVRLELEASFSSPAFYA